MPREMLPTHQWYVCDGCGTPQLKARLSPKQLVERTVKCKFQVSYESALWPRCNGHMIGPIDNPFPDNHTLDVANFVPRPKPRKKKSDASTDA